MITPRLKSFTWRSELTAGPRLIKAGDLRRSLAPGTRRVVHEHWVLDYCVEDSGRTRIGAEDHPWFRRRGLTAHLYPPKTVYWERSEEPRRLHHSLYIGFLDGETAGLDELIDSDLGGGRFADPERRLLELIIQCVEVGEALGQRGFWRAQAVFQSVIGLLRHSRISPDGQREIGPAVWTGQSDFVHLVRDVLRRSSGRKTTLTEIAAAANVSVSTLTHRYRRETGRSPMRQHAELRIERAKELLSLGEPLTTIAETLEFGDVFHFSKAFKRIAGITPSVFKSGDERQLERGQE